MQTNRFQEDIGSERVYGQTLAGFQSVHYVNQPSVNFVLMEQSMTMQVNSDQNQAKSKVLQNNYMESHRRCQKN